MGLYAQVGGWSSILYKLVMVGWPAITHILLVIYLLCIPLFTIATPMVGRPRTNPMKLDYGILGLRKRLDHDTGDWSIQATMGVILCSNESLFVSLKSESFLGIFASGRLRGCSHIFVFSETMNPKEAVQLSRSKCQSHPSPFGSFHGSNLMMSSGGNVLKTIWRQIFIVSSPRPNRKYLWDLSSSVYTAHVHINTWRTDTHLLRNILSNYWCGTHLTCKNTSVKPDRSSWKTRSEKLCKGNLSMSLLEESNRSDAARSSSIDSGKSDFDNRAEKRWESNRLSGSRLSRMPSAKINEVVKVILQAMSTTSMPRSAGTGEWSVHPSPIIP